jgi:hypothetical protein
MTVPRNRELHEWLRDVAEDWRCRAIAAPPRRLAVPREDRIIAGPAGRRAQRLSHLRVWGTGTGGDELLGVMVTIARHILTIGGPQKVAYLKRVKSSISVSSDAMNNKRSEALRSRLARHAKN